MHNAKPTYLLVQWQKTEVVSVRWNLAMDSLLATVLMWY